MASIDPPTPTREALEEMAPDKRTSRAIELLFIKVQDLETRLAAAEATIAAEHP